MELRRSPDAFCTSRYCATSSSIAARSSGATFATITFWFAVRGMSPLCPSAIRRRPGAPRAPPRHVLDAAVRDVERQVRLAVLALDPTVAVAGRGECERLGRLARHARGVLALGTGRGQPALH